MSKSNNTIEYINAFVIVNKDGRRYINRPIYTGRAPDMWSSIGDSHVFYDKRQAQRCSYDINRRSDAREPFAFVVPIQLERRNTTTNRRTR